MSKEDDKVRIGLALSGGGARGIAHIGVLRALEEEGIFPDEISGSSAGAIAGALYASGISPERMLDFVKGSSIMKILKVTVPYSGLAKLTYLQEQLERFIESDRFEDLKRKLYITVTNLNKGRSEVLSGGKLFQAVLASSAIPLVFKPITINGELFVDGGMLNNMPVQPLVDADLDIIIGVNVMPLVEASARTVQSALGVATRCFDLSIQSNTKPNESLCDVVIEPRRVHAYNIFQLNKYKDLEQIGYQATMEKMPEIKKVIRTRTQEKQRDPAGKEAVNRGE